MIVELFLSQNAICSKPLAGTICTLRRLCCNSSSAFTNASSLVWFNCWRPCNSFVAQCFEIVANPTADHEFSRHLTLVLAPFRCSKYSSSRCGPWKWSVENHGTWPRPLAHLGNHQPGLRSWRQPVGSGMADVNPMVAKNVCQKCIQFFPNAKTFLSNQTLHVKQ